MQIVSQPHKNVGHPSGTSRSPKLVTRDGYGMSQGQIDAKWRPFKNTAMLFEVVSIGFPAA
jgi:hypothetical protein